MNTKLYLLRHAQRDPAGDFDNPGISTLGRDQATKLGQALKGLLTTQPIIYSSPKKRAFETATLACGVLESSFEVHSDLDEKHGAETQSKFQKRIEQFLYHCPATKELVLFSHQDWLESFEAHFLSSQRLHIWELAKGHVFEMHLPQMQYLKAIGG